MRLKDSCEKAGNWLFRFRSYLPIGMIAIFLFSLRNFYYLGGSEEFDRVWELFCLSISFFGLFIRIITIGHTPKGTSGRNTKEQIAEKLNTTGIYSIVRNPLYLGNFFMGLGCALFVHLFWPVLVYILAFWIYYERIIFAEEEFLSRKFSKEYDSWAAKTPIFMPSFKHYVKPDLPFSLKNVLKREYNGFFAVIAIFFTLEVTGDFVVEHKFELDAMWVTIAGGGFIVWMILRTLKKMHLLDVEGR